MNTHRAGALSGILAPGITLGAILLATLLSPTFTWTGSALSNLGGAGERTAWLFNGGLMVGSLVALPFVAVIVRAARNWWQRVGVGFLALSLVALFSVGVFPIGTAYHFPAALSFYLLLTLALWVHGTGSVIAADVSFGLASIWLGIANIMTWMVWVSTGDLTRSGLAIPEIIGALIFGGWMAFAARRLFARPRTAVSQPLSKTD
ncbi:DUF998 domain-containing protein [Haladaptatus sp. GCM10025707]|uniref:DUF998 domain-containing protein n=1 Tax=unclassified Haladaptatus TaxID=2622732 RepID=UPI0023E75A4D|nr:MULTISPECIES: DUF998 domain-containing protein [unclassified Haladaptatus]